MLGPASGFNRLDCFVVILRPLKVVARMACMVVSRERSHQHTEEGQTRRPNATARGLGKRYLLETKPRTAATAS